MAEAERLWALNAVGFRDSDTFGDEARRQANLKLAREAQFKWAGVIRDDARLAEAQKAYGALFKQCTKELGPAHPDTVEALQRLADCLDAQGEAALGFSSVNERRCLVEVLEATLYPSHPRVVRAQLALARALLRFTSPGGQVGGGAFGGVTGGGAVGVDDGGEGTAGDPQVAEAVALLLQAVAGAQESLGETVTETCEGVELLGHALRLRGDSSAELFWRRELLAACERAGGAVGDPPSEATHSPPRSADKASGKSKRGGGGGAAASVGTGEKPSPRSAGGGGVSRSSRSRSGALPTPGGGDTSRSAGATSVGDGSLATGGRRAGGPGGPADAEAEALARADAAWNHVSTITAGLRLAGALEHRAFNLPGVLVDEEEALLDEAEALRLKVCARFRAVQGDTHEDTAFAHVQAARLIAKRRCFSEVSRGPPKRMAPLPCASLSPSRVQS